MLLLSAMSALPVDPSRLSSFQSIQQKGRYSSTLIGHKINHFIVVYVMRQLGGLTLSPPCGWFLDESGF